ALFLFILASFLTSSLSALEYRVLELSPLAGQSAKAGEGSAATAAFALSNRAGEDETGAYVVGTSGHQAVRWRVKAGSVRAADGLGASPAAASIAYGVNDAGHVVGAAGADAFFWNPAARPTLQLIASPRSAHCSAARGINNHDLVVGTCTDAAKTRLAT